MLFISSILHQTTTHLGCQFRVSSLFISSILHQTTTFTFGLRQGACCLYLQSYTKPQPRTSRHLHSDVVYIFNPTPNHNWLCTNVADNLLFISSILHQTTTRILIGRIQTSCLYLQSYTKPQLEEHLHRNLHCCLYLQSYTKPQHIIGLILLFLVVYIFNPTPNHNAY